MAGTYAVTAIAGFAKPTTAGQIDLKIVKNGTPHWAEFKDFTSAGYTTKTVQVKGSVYLLAGDYIEIKTEHSYGTTALIGDASRQRVSIERVGGSELVQPGEKVYASYACSNSSSVSDNTATLIDYDTKLVDSHGAVTTGGSWKFTAPMAGFYTISASDSLVFGVFCVFGLIVRKNGTAAKRHSIANEAGISSTRFAEISHGLFLNAGDYIDVQVLQESGGSRNRAGDATYSIITISKV
jgi:hypothetical protein